MSPVPRRVAGAVLSAAERASLTLARVRPVRPGVRVLGYHELPDPELLTAHVSALRTHGTVIDEDSFLDAVAGRVAWPSTEAWFLITADDGLAANFAPPMLRAVEALRIRPLLFLIGTVCEPARLRTLPHLEQARDGTPRPLATAEDVGRGLAAGWTIGSHTWTHRDCATLGDDGLDDEVVSAASRLRAEFGVPLRSFAWPWGQPRHTSAPAKAAVAAAGHEVAFSTVGGRMADPPADRMFVPRSFAGDHAAVDRLGAVLRGALDPLDKARAARR